MLEDGQLVELHQDNGQQDYSVGDIYLGRVKKVLPSLNAGFVDVGIPRMLSSTTSTSDRNTAVLKVYPAFHQGNAGVFRPRQLQVGVGH